MEPTRPRTVTTLHSGNAPQTKEQVTKATEIFAQLLNSANQQLPTSAYRNAPNIVWIKDLIFHDLVQLAEQDPCQQSEIGHMIQYAFAGLSFLNGYGISACAPAKMQWLASSPLEQVEMFKSQATLKDGYRYIGNALAKAKKDRLNTQQIETHLGSLLVVTQDHPELLSQQLSWQSPSTKQIIQRTKMRMQMLELATKWLKKPEWVEILKELGCNLKGPRQRHQMADIQWPKGKAAIDHHLVYLANHLREAKAKRKHNPLVGWIRLRALHDQTILDYGAWCDQLGDRLDKAIGIEKDPQLKSCWRAMQLMFSMMHLITDVIHADFVDCTHKFALTDGVIQRRLRGLPQLLYEHHAQAKEAYPNTTTTAVLEKSTKSPLIAYAKHVRVMSVVIDTMVPFIHQVGQLPKTERTKIPRLYETFERSLLGPLRDRIEACQREAKNCNRLTGEERMQFHLLQNFTSYCGSLKQVILESLGLSFVTSEEWVEKEARVAAAQLEALVDLENNSRIVRRRRRRRKKKAGGHKRPAADRRTPVVDRGSPAITTAESKPLTGIASAKGVDYDEKSRFSFPTATGTSYDTVAQLISQANHSELATPYRELADSKRIRILFILARLTSAQNQSDSPVKVIRQLDGTRRLVENLSNYVIARLGLEIQGNPLPFSSAPTGGLQPVSTSHRLDFYHRLLTQAAPSAAARVINQHANLFQLLALSNRQIWHGAQFAPRAQAYTQAVGPGVSQLQSVLQTLQKHSLQRQHHAYQEVSQKSEKVVRAGLTLSVELLQALNTKKEPSWSPHLPNNFTVDITRLPVSRLRTLNNAAVDVDETEPTAPPKKQYVTSTDTGRMLGPAVTVQTMKQLTAILSVIGQSQVLSPHYQGSERRTLRNDYLHDAQFVLLRAKELLLAERNQQDTLRQWELQHLFVRSLSLLHRAALAHLPAYHQGRHILLTCPSNQSSTLGFCNHLGTLNTVLRNCEARLLDSAAKKTFAQSASSLPDLSHEYALRKLYGYLNNPERLSHYQGKHPLLLQLKKAWSHSQGLLDQSQGFKRQKTIKLDLSQSIANSLGMIRQMVCFGFSQP